MWRGGRGTKFHWIKIHPAKKKKTRKKKMKTPEGGQPDRHNKRHGLSLKETDSMRTNQIRTTSKKKGGRKKIDGGVERGDNKETDH